MKKISLLLLLITAGGIASAQKSVAFKIKFLPRHVYKVSNNLDVDMNMKVPDSLAKLANMPPEGIKFKVTATHIFDIKTGVKEADGGFPYQIKYDTLYTKTIINNEEKSLPVNSLVGVVIKGRCTPEGKMHVDTIPDTKSTPQTQQAIKEMINKIVDQVKFPEKPLSVGETFTQDMPLAIPIPGQSSQIDMRCVYKLISIEGNKANFDITINLNMGDMKAPGTGMTLNGTGEGTGKMVYLIDKSYPEKQTTNFDMRMNMMMNNTNMHMDIKAISDVSTEISAN